jgi:hypothetical protein
VGGHAGIGAGQVHNQWLIIGKEARALALGQKVDGNLKQDLRPLINLAIWSLEQNTENIPKLLPPDPRKAMHWNKALFPDGLDRTLGEQFMAN